MTEQNPIATKIAGFLWQDDKDGFIEWVQSLSDADRAEVHRLAQQSAWISDSAIRATRDTESERDND